MAHAGNLKSEEILAVLPNELVCHIFSFLSLKDLSESRLVCHRFQDIIDCDRYKYLWASAPLLDSCEWVDDYNRIIIHRAADCGNVEALIKLAVAYIYCEGASEGADKGTIHYSNAVIATRLLLQAERLNGDRQPFSWVLFRPPWSPNCTCCKACIWHQLMKQSNETQECLPQVHYLLGKPLLFLDEVQRNSWPSIAEHVFSLGSSLFCPYALFEQWKMNYKHKIYLNEFDALRKLRKLVLAVPTFWDVQMELCIAYSQGYYGGLSKNKAVNHLYYIFQSSMPFISRFTSKNHSLTTSVRYILVDWLVEVADMKQFSSTTVHLAMSLIDRYLQQRHVKRSNLQLLGVTALLLSSRWTSDFILTIRESSWLTENAYGYDKVVRMMGSLLAVLHGQLSIPIISDYLRILVLLSDANSLTGHLCNYLSEKLLHHTGFGHLTCGHLAAACFLLARLVLREVCPWPEALVKCTGYSIYDLQGTCLKLYTYCLTDTHSITDNRAMKLQAVVQRYGSDEFDNVSKYPIPTFNVVKDQLACISQNTKDCSVKVADKSIQGAQICSGMLKAKQASCDKLSFTMTVQCSSSNDESSPPIASVVRLPLGSVDTNVSCHAGHQLKCNDVKCKTIRNASSKQ